MSAEQNAPDLSAIIGKLTADPALLSNLISSLGGGTQSAEEAPKPAAPAIDTDMITKLLPAVSAIASPSGTKKPSPRCELLIALKPFLSPERCRAIDYIVKMDGLGGLLQNMK